MNWTGGRLQRSKNANKGVVQKQKAHFARARTRLQNGSTTPSSPFRPSFFRDEEGSLGGRLPHFSSRTIRHTGHSRTLQQRASTKGPAAIRSDPNAGETEELGTETSRQRRVDERALENTRSDTRRKKRLPLADPEERLLDARRKRLLQQRDWVGLTRLKPIPMHFPSTEEKERIGKRRKVRDDRALTKRKGNSTFVRRQLRIEDSKQPGRFMDGALQKENIRIRIGTAALTNFTPPQQSLVQSTPRGESSDTMLFENEDMHANTKVGLHPGETGDHDSWTRDSFTFVGVHEQDRAAPPEMRGEGSQNYRLSGEEAARISPHRDCRASAMRHNKQDQRESSQKPSSARVDQGEEDDLSGCHIMQHVGGVCEPLRLVFDRISDKLAAFEADSTIGETNHTQNPANARSHEKGNNQAHSNAGSALYGQPQIVDDGPWRSFLTIPEDNSSFSTTIDASPIAIADRAQQRYRANNIESVSWSQRATQGGQTRISSSSCVSASLPSIMQDNGIATFGSRPQKQPEPDRSSGKKQCDEDEQFWQAFLFGNGDHAISDTSQGDKVIIPSSVTAGSLSLTPFRPVSRLANCVSDSVHDAAARAPLPTSSGSMLPMILSPAAPLGPCQAQGLNVNEDGAQRSAEPSGFGDHSLTHTSIQNNVSYDPDASPTENSSDAIARATRNGLDRRGGRKSGRFVPLKARKCEPASIYDIPVSEDGC